MSTSLMYRGYDKIEMLICASAKLEFEFDSLRKLKLQKIDSIARWCRQSQPGYSAGKT
jgi:hypothetical protein